MNLNVLPSVMSDVVATQCIIWSHHFCSALYQRLTHCHIKPVGGAACFFFAFYIVFECKLLFKCRKDFDYVWKLISTVVFHHRTQSGCELNCLMLLVELMIKSSHVRSKNNTPSETGIGPQVNMLCMQTSSHFPYLWGHMFNFDLKFSSYTIYIVQTWKPTDRPSHLKFWH